MGIARPLESGLLVEPPSLVVAWNEVRTGRAEVAATWGEGRQTGVAHRPQRKGRDAILTGRYDLGKPFAGKGAGISAPRRSSVVPRIMALGRLAMGLIRCFRIPRQSFLAYATSRR